MSLLKPLMACLLAAAITTGCGTRVDQPEPAAATRGSGAAEPAPAWPGMENAGSLPASALHAPAPTAPPRNDRRTTGVPPSPGGTMAGPGVRAADPTAVPSGGGPKTAAPPATRPAPSGSPPAAPAPVVAGSPVVIANVGTQSGPVGNAMVPFVQGIQLWVKDVNARGGLNGHPVKFLVLDDNSDPGRHRALVQEAVEVRHALAFLGNAAPLSGGAGVAYVTDKKIPVILVCGCEPWAYESPMMFPATANGDTALRVIIESAATRSVPAGKAKLGVLACAEAQVCRDADRVWAKHARDFGFTQVYRGQYSITQPDFTAECLAMRNSGAEFTQITATPSTFRNIVASCTRQGYRPTYGMTLSMVEEGQKDDSTLQGAMASALVFPYFQTGTPATDAFATALRNYGQGLTPGLGLTQGWTGGKLLERAAAALPEPPTTGAILNGLWSVKGDDLGGLTGPLSFTANQPATPVACWFNLELRGRWISPDRFERHCEQ